MALLVKVMEMRKHFLLTLRFQYGMEKGTDSNVLLTSESYILVAHVVRQDKEYIGLLAAC